MDETAAREVLLVRALDRAEPAVPAWTAADRAWASRVAVETVGGAAAPETFLAARAHAGLQRVLPRERPATREVWTWLQRPLWRPGWVPAGFVGGLAIGALLDGVAGGSAINLLSLAIFGVLGWNLLVYVLLLVRPLAALFLGARGPGPLVQALRRLTRIDSVTVKPRALADLGLARLWPGFVADWLQAASPLLTSLFTTVLHAAAAGVAVGGLASLYLRGLVMDYRAGWESTFLDPGLVHGLLGTVLGPASAITGIALPDAAGVAALQLGPGATGAPAAPWIHLYAVTVGLLVVLPRALLMFVGLARAARRARRFPLPLSEPYYQHVLRQHRPAPAGVRVWPHATAPSAQATLALRSLCARVWGDAVGLEVLPPVAWGDEDALALPGGDTDVALALFDMNATPEVEQQGRLLQSLADALPAGVPVLVVVNESAFLARFAGLPERIDQRRAAWQALAGRFGTTAVFIDLGAQDTATAEAGLQAALDRPLQRAAA
jgi:hypothetical protein